MEIELESIEVHEAIRIHKKNQNGIRKSDADLSYLPYLGIVIVRPKTGTVKIVSFTNIRSAVPASTTGIDALVECERNRFPVKKSRKSIKLGNPS